MDAADKCVDEPEDFDGFDDQDGCPDLDNDADGLLDTDDGCPDEAEDRDDFHDEDGCPDDDNDLDGFADGEDACPNVPAGRDDANVDGCPDDDDGDGVANESDQCLEGIEDRDGFEDDDGCPDPDNDGDGLLGTEDACPDEPEDFDLHEDSDGCPEPDDDADGVPDAKDICPGEAEDGEGRYVENGCGVTLREVYLEPELKGDPTLQGAFELTRTVYGMNPGPKNSDFNYRVVLVGVGVTALTTPLTFTFEAGIGRGTAKQATPRFAWEADESEPLQRFAFGLSARFGARILSWPARRWAGFSLANPVLGLSARMKYLAKNRPEDLDEMSNYGIGPWLRQTFQYERVQLILDVTHSLIHRPKSAIAAGGQRANSALAWTIGVGFVTLRPKGEWDK